MSPGKRGEWLSILLVLDSKRSRGLYQRLISPDVRHIYTLSIEDKGPHDCCGQLHA